MAGKPVITQQAMASLVAALARDPGMAAWKERHGGELFKELSTRPDLYENPAIVWNGLIQCRQTGPRYIPQRKRKLMLQDPQIKLGVSAREAPVMASFSMPQVHTTDALIEAYLMAALVPRLRRIVKIMLRSHYYGYIPCEKIFEVRDLDLMVTNPDRTVTMRKFRKAVVLKDLWDLDPERWYPFITKKGDFAGVGMPGHDPAKPEQWVPSLKSPVKPADKAFIMVNDPEFRSLTGKSVLDAIYEPWTWGVYLHAYCNRYYEKRAIPPVIGYAPTEVADETGTTVSGTETLGTIAEHLTGESIGIMPNDTIEGTNLRQWSLEFAQEDKRGEMFLPYMDYLQTLKLRGLVIPERVLTQAQGYGTFAMALKHTETFETNETLILEDILECLNRWIVDPLLKMNFGPNHAPARLDTVIKIADRRDLLANIVTAIIASEAKGASSPTAAVVDTMRVYQQLNMPVKPIGAQQEGDLATALASLPQLRDLSLEVRRSPESRLDTKPLQQAVYEEIAKREGRSAMVSKMADAATKLLVSQM